MIPFYILDELTTDFIVKIYANCLSYCRSWSIRNTVVIIEHNLDVAKVADYIIDLGPEGGDKGGGSRCRRNSLRKSVRFPDLMNWPIFEAHYRLDYRNNEEA